MHNKRIFNNETMPKLDGVLRYLFSKKIKYCVSYFRDAERAGNFKAMVTWYD